MCLFKLFKLLNLVSHKSPLNIFCLFGPCHAYTWYDSVNIAWNGKYVDRTDRYDLSFPHHHGVSYVVRYYASMRKISYKLHTSIFHLTLDKQSCQSIWKFCFFLSMAFHLVLYHGFVYACIIMLETEKWINSEHRHSPYPGFQLSYNV